LDIAHPIFFFLPFILYYISRKLTNERFAVLLFPLFWTIFEWLHSIGDMGYSWLSIAHTQYTNLTWYQILDIAGIWLPVLLIALVNTLIFMLLRDGKKSDGKFAWRSIFSTTQKKIYATIIYAAIVLPMVYGYITISNYDYMEDLEQNDFINIGLLQPNVNPWDKWEKSGMEQIMTHLRLQDSLIQKDGKLNLCIWSETAIPMLDLSVNRDMKLDIITDNLVKNDVSLLTGIARLRFWNKDAEQPITTSYFLQDTNQPYSSYNSALLINTKKDGIDELQFHDKGKLTPFAEGFPYVEYLGFAKDWLKWGIGISSWTKGTEMECLTVRNDGRTAQIAPIICIESVYPDFVRKFVENGANIIVVITNDAWYNYSPGPEQHFIIAATRAIENRRYVARAANSGVTGFITPIGKTMSRVPQYEQVAIAASIPIMNADNKTIYTLYGDFLPEIASVVAVLAVIIQMFRKRQNAKEIG
jgi:apolipoprotein N-acyltransferase